MWVGAAGPLAKEHRSTEVAARAALQPATADAQNLLLPPPFLCPRYQGRRSRLSSRSRLWGSRRGGQCLDLAGIVHHMRSMYSGSPQVRMGLYAKQQPVVRLTSPLPVAKGMVVLQAGPHRKGQHQMTVHNLHFPDVPPA